ncbi:hypothetical protein GCG54_00003850 [Colletotrichum gloeosporioides]|uniref:Uncharacterized protein n=1 Tax=Colletotrichum gloeosporioides TaxID=474922 RepID=A0A8H4C5T8_COLGL|nr:uncharacterized protein GCG54_00003850 [Colletotrichum gloeosporioides]KAF3797951.1 hypothetical protein GCG54_00003850 [Colletotrichum gloeosporioides]
MLGLSGWKPLFFYTAAFLNVVILPKHLKTGETKIKGAIKAIPSDPEYSIPKAIVKTAWDGCNSLLLTFALLNLKWAKHGAPELMEEKLAVWINVIISLYIGIPYFQVGMKLPLFTLWGGPVLTTMAMLL